MTPASALLTLALLACAAMLCIGGRLLVRSSWRTQFGRGAIFLALVIGALGELVVEGTLTTDPALGICVPSGDRSHLQRSMGEQLALTIVLTHWPTGPEAFGAREVRLGSRAQSAIAPPDTAAKVPWAVH